LIYYSNDRIDCFLFKAPATPSGAISGIKSSDLVEDALRQRQRAAEERKKRMLAAYDSAARSGPAGAPKEVNFEAFKKVDGKCFSHVRCRESDIKFDSVFK
jgi:hypothetical protein